MPPKKNAKAPKVDLRSFFAPSSSVPSRSAAPSQSFSSSQKLSKKTVSPKKPETIEISDSDEEVKPKKKVASSPAVATSSKRKLDSDVESSDRKQKRQSIASSPPKTSDYSEDEPQPKSKPKAVKRVLSSDEEEDEKPTPKKLAPAASTLKLKAAVKPRQSVTKHKTEDDFVVPDDDSEDNLVPSKKQVTKAAARKPAKAAPAESSKSATAEAGQEKPKFNYYAFQMARSTGPVAPGSKPIPEPKSMDCLAGLTFVFTGELSSLSRDEAVELAKRYGGRVTGAPSKKTSYVILGENAGPSKLAKIKALGVETLDEDEYLNLIGTRKGPGNGKGLDEKTKKKMEKEKEAIRAGAEAMEAKEREAEKQQKHDSASGVKTIDPSSQLWTTRYAPTNIKEICGNKGQVEKLNTWLKEWQNNYKAGFKKPGPIGLGLYRAVLLSGGPGIGKTTSAHLCAKLAGYTPIEVNASDARSKKLVENGMNVNNTSLDGYFGGAAAQANGDVITAKSCLIMDEVDGMSSGDRGGVGALNALIKKTQIPIICIANDSGSQKLKPLMHTTFKLKFSKPQVTEVRSRMMSVIFKEKMKIPANVVDQLINGAQSDIRQVLNMLSTWRLSSNSMNFDEGKMLAKMNEKYTMMSPFDITNKVLGPYLFSANARETLGDKMELYFQDAQFMPLFIQENYLKVTPAKLRNCAGSELDRRLLELMDDAASSISDGDLVDAMIHGPEQHWALMPLHAVCSTIRPASKVYGNGLGYGGPSPTTFPQWLGQNSKQNKLNRQLGDVQIHMRLKVSGDKSEIRQSYLPALFPHIVQPLIGASKAAANSVEDVINIMDDYYLSKDDWDTIVELGVGEKSDEAVLKKIPTANKSSLTKKYNAQEHPIPFHKQDLGKATTKMAAAPRPDLEEAFDLDDDVAEVSDDEKDKKPKALDDFGKDRLLKKSAPKGKNAK